MTKVVALITRKIGISQESFLHHWQIEHPRYVWALPGLRRYVQNPSVHGKRTWAYDGMAELWFDSVGDVARAFASPEAVPLHKHEEEFIGEVSWFLADEHEVPRTRKRP